MSGDAFGETEPAKKEKDVTNAYAVSGEKALCRTGLSKCWAPTLQIGGTPVAQVRVEVNARLQAEPSRRQIVQRAV
jgi:hypothetical protein